MTVAETRTLAPLEPMPTTEAQAWGLVNRVVPGAGLAAAVADYAALLAKKPFRPMAEVKARINAIARAGIPEVNAMTEGFLGRE